MRILAITHAHAGKCKRRSVKVYVVWNPHWTGNRKFLSVFCLSTKTTGQMLQCQKKSQWSRKPHALRKGEHSYIFLFRNVTMSLRHWNNMYFPFVFIKHGQTTAFKKISRQLSFLPPVPQILDLNSPPYGPLLIPAGPPSPSLRVAKANELERGWNSLLLPETSIVLKH